MPISGVALPRLHPKARSDRGVPRVLTPEQERHILEQVKAHPAIPSQGALPSMEGSGSQTARL